MGALELALRAQQKGAQADQWYVCAAPRLPSVK